MTAAELSPALYGALLLGCFVIGLKFVKFWRLSRDRFFIWFAAAFWLFTVGWGLRAFLPSVGEHAYLVFVPRLLGFLMIIVAIFDKNRRASSD
jgi:hypothetical protein